MPDKPITKPLPYLYPRMAGNQGLRCPSCKSFCHLPPYCYLNRYVCLWHLQRYAQEQQTPWYAIGGFGHTSNLAGKHWDTAVGMLALAGGIDHAFVALDAVANQSAHEVGQRHRSAIAKSGQGVVQWRRRMLRHKGHQLLHLALGCGGGEGMAQPVTLCSKGGQCRRSRGIGSLTASGQAHRLRIREVFVRCVSFRLD